MGFASFSLNITRLAAVCLEGETEVEDYLIQVFGRHAIDTDTGLENEKHRKSSSLLRLPNTLVACRFRPAWRIDGHLQVDHKVSAYVGHIRRLG